MLVFIGGDQLQGLMKDYRQRYKKIKIENHLIRLSSIGLRHIPYGYYTRKVGAILIHSDDTLPENTNYFISVEIALELVKK